MSVAENLKNFVGGAAAAERSSIWSRLLALPSRILGSYLLAVTVALLFLAPWMSYACKSVWVPVGVPMAAIALVLAIGLAWLVKVAASAAAFSKMRSGQGFGLAVALGWVALTAMQAVVVQGCWFKTGWDVRFLTSFDPNGSGYYSVYPNQVLLAGVFAWVARAGSVFGFSNGYLCVVCVGCLCVGVSAVLAAFIARRLGGFAVGYCTFLLSSALFGLSPWILVPYSDTFAMLPVTLALFSYVCIEKRPLAWCLASASALVGYWMKPTVVFVFAAAVLVASIGAAGRLVQAGCAAKRRRIACKAGACLLGAVVGLCLATAVSAPFRGFVEDVDPSKAFGASHFLMMGANPERRGVYAADDVAFSASYATVGERDAADVARWLGRVADAGPLGAVGLLADKSLTNYGDGTFAWEREGGFYLSVGGDSDVLQSIYGIGRDPNLFAPLAQIVWLMVLVGCVLGCFSKGASSDGVRVVCLALLLLSVFLMLFECRARYLFLYGPCFAVLAVLGWRAAASRMSCLCGREER